MTELHQILGSLFSDIAQSIFTSDLYSRDISRYYEQDGLLRHFPVPRTEISELEVDLKFAIAGVELNPAQTIGREVNAATIFIDLSFDLSESFYEELHDILVELKEQHKNISDATLEQTASGVNSIYLRQDLLRFFQKNIGSLIDEGNFQIKKAREEVSEILVKHLGGILGNDLPTKEKEAVLKRVIEAIQLDQRLRALEDPLRFAWNRAGDFKLDVEITASKLSELSAEHLSSVRVRTRVRNYKWSEVEHEGRRWWRLNPE